MMIVLQFQFLAILLLGILLGLIVVTMTDWRLSVLLSGAFLSHMLVTAIYRAPQTVEYMLPAYIPAVIAFGCGLSWWWVDLGDKMANRSGSLLSGIGACLFQGVQNRSSYTLSAP